MAKKHHYAATLDTQAKLVVQPREDQTPQVHIDFGQHLLPVAASHQVRYYLQEHGVGDEAYHLKLWPRTTPDGYLANSSFLRYVLPLKSDELEPETTKEQEEPQTTGTNPSTHSKGATEGFYALGKLLYIDREEARFGLIILPNLKASLKKPFKMSFCASLELLESLPKKGAGLRVWGELKPQSLRLMAKRVEEVELPPTGWVEKVAPKEEPVAKPEEA